jgi:hypothetical protein
MHSPYFKFTHSASERNNLKAILILEMTYYAPVSSEQQNFIEEWTQLPE